MGDDTRNQLVSLGAERLADALMQLATQDDSAQRTVTRLISNPQQNLGAFTNSVGDIQRLCRSNRYFSRGGARDLAAALEECLADLREADVGPEDGMNLVTNFMRLGPLAIESCDGSDGLVGSVFTYDALNLFASFAGAASDHEAVIHRMIELYGNDPYSLHERLPDLVHLMLPRERWRQVVDRFTDLAEATDNVSQRKVWLRGVESVALQLEDPQLFEKARRAAYPDLKDWSRLDIGAAYLQAGDAETAVTWLEGVEDLVLSRRHSRDDLLLQAYTKLGRSDAAAHVAQRRFRTHRTTSTLDDLLAVIGEEQRPRVLDEEAELIVASPEFKIGDVQFLIAVDRVDDAETTVLRHDHELNGMFYSSLVPVAEHLTQSQRPVAASLIYRALLDSILDRAYSRAYRHGVRYLVALDTLAATVADWRGHDDHTAYTEGLRARHGRKRSFWSRYVEQ